MLPDFPEFNRTASLPVSTESFSSRTASSPNTLGAKSMGIKLAVGNHSLEFFMRGVGCIRLGTGSTEDATVDDIAMLLLVVCAVVVVTMVVVEKRLAKDRAATTSAIGGVFRGARIPRAPLQPVATTRDGM